MLRVAAAVDPLPAASSMDPRPNVATEPAPKPAGEKSYRLLREQEVPPASLHTRTEGRQKLRGCSRRSRSWSSTSSTSSSSGADPSQSIRLDDAMLLDKELNLGGVVPPPWVKLHRRLAKRLKVLKVHLKHCDMSPAQFRRRTSELYLPEVRLSPLRCCEGLQSMSEDKACSAKSTASGLACELKVG